MEYSNNQIKELHNIVSKLPIRMFCVTVLPEFGMRWRDVARTIRNSRLAMTPSNIARVMCKHVSKTVPDDDIDEIVARLRLKFIATQSRTWHVITLSEQHITESIEQTIESLPKRVMLALKQGKTSHMRSVVHTVMLENLMFVSLQLVSGDKEGPVLYAATPPGEPVALVTSLTAAKLTRALVEGLGYSKYEDAKLHGHDIMSLLRIHNRLFDDQPDTLDGIPEYAPVPVATSNGIDYTNRQYDEQYIDNILGPDPPLLTELNIKSVKQFFDRTILDKAITLNIQLKSDDIATTLKSWVKNGALGPTCDFLKIFHKIKSNNIVYNMEESD